MRCKFCPFTTFDYSDNVQLCAIFGWGEGEISENRKGEDGCRYNYATLAKMRQAELDSIIWATGKREK